MKKTSWKKWSVVLGIAVFGGMLVAQADVNYTFVDDGLATDTPFDGAGIGANDTLLDDTYPVNITLTTVDIRGMDGSLASQGTNNTSNVVGNSDTLGINSQDNILGASNDPRDFDPGEAWMFSFNVPVKLVEIDLSSQGAGARMTFSSSAFSDIILDDGATGDIHALGDVLVPAGTVITLAMSNVPGLGTDTTVRITDFTVAAIPEPATLGLMSACAVGAFMIRRFRV